MEIIGSQNGRGQGIELNHQIQGVFMVIIRDHNEQ